MLALQECNLYQLMKGCQGMLPEHLVREWCATIFEGLAFIHKQGYFHRDLKPGAFTPSQLPESLQHPHIGALHSLSGKSAILALALPRVRNVKKRCIQPMWPFSPPR